MKLLGCQQSQITSRHSFSVVIALQSCCQRIGSGGEKGYSPQNSQTNNFHSHRAAVSLPPLRKPLRKPFGKSLRRQPETRLHAPLAHRQSIVKLRRIREISHAELVQPFHGTSLPLAPNQYIHTKSLRVHAQIIAPQLARLDPLRLHLVTPELASRVASNLNCPDTRRNRTIPPVFVVPSAFPGPVGLCLSICFADTAHPFFRG